MKQKPSETKPVIVDDGNPGFRCVQVPMVDLAAESLPADSVIVLALHAPTAQMVLAALLPVINQIHGGCDVCRNHFADRANAVLAADGVPWRLSRQYDALGCEVKGPDGQMLDLVLLAAP
jgi:hypothetical protein